MSSNQSTIGYNIDSAAARDTIRSFRTIRSCISILGQRYLLCKSSSTLLFPLLSLTLQCIRLYQITHKSIICLQAAWVTFSSPSKNMRIKLLRSGNSSWRPFSQIKYFQPIAQVKLTTSQKDPIRPNKLSQEFVILYYQILFYGYPNWNALSYRAFIKLRHHPK